MRAADEDVASYLKLLTLMPLGEITDVLHAHSVSSSITGKCTS